MTFSLWIISVVCILGWLQICRVADLLADLVHELRQARKVHESLRDGLFDAHQSWSDVYRESRAQDDLGKDRLP